ADGSAGAGVAITAAGGLVGPVARAAIEGCGSGRLAAVHTASDLVRRGGTVSISGVYGGMADPMPMMSLFDKGVQLRMGQCHVRRWTDELLRDLLGDEDVFALEELATHRLTLEDAPEAYAMFQQKRDGCIKVVLQP